MYVVELVSSLAQLFPYSSQYATLYINYFQYKNIFDVILLVFTAALPLICLLQNFKHLKKIKQLTVSRRFYIRHRDRAIMD